jgi:WD40 repeat protein
MSIRVDYGVEAKLLETRIMSDLATGVPRRRTVRISLRTWLVTIAVITCLLAWQSRRSVLLPTNVASLREVASLDEDIYEIAWSPERDRMALLSRKTAAIVRDSLSLKTIDNIGEGQKLMHFAFSPDKDVVAYCRNRKKTAEILDRRTGRTISLDVGNDQPRMTFSPDGTTLATGGYGTISHLWRVSDGKLLRGFDAGPTMGGLTPVFNPDGTMLAVGNRNAETRIFEVATGKVLHVLDPRQTQGLQFSPDGRNLAVAYVDGSLRLWNTVDGRLRHELKTTAEELYRVEWSPDGQILASAGLKGKITLWNPADLSILREIDAPDWVIGLRFSPDGRNLITAGGASGLTGPTTGKRSLKIWGVEGSLFSITNRPR